MPYPVCRWISLAALPALLAGGVCCAADGITIYRCTDAQGRLSLRDTPCGEGQTQQTRQMQRPRDPPPQAQPIASPVATPSAPPTPATRYPAVAPRPMYECVQPDGSRYISDTVEGNPRWVPLWSLGYPVMVPRGGSSIAIIGMRPARPAMPVDRPIPVHPHPPTIASYPAGTWVRDECHALPPQEVCARLRDRRWELDRNYNSALQSERHDIEREQRGIDARLDNDCGGH